MPKKQTKPRPGSVAAKILEFGDEIPAPDVAESLGTSIGNVYGVRRKYSKSKSNDKSKSSKGSPRSSSAPKKKMSPQARAKLSKSMKAAYAKKKANKPKTTRRGKPAPVIAAAIADGEPKAGEIEARAELAASEARCEVYRQALGL